MFTGSMKRKAALHQISHKTIKKITVLHFYDYTKAIYYILCRHKIFVTLNQQMTSF